MKYTQKSFIVSQYTKAQDDADRLRKEIRKSKFWRNPFVSEDISEGDYDQSGMSPEPKDAA